MLCPWFIVHYSYASLQLVVKSLIFNNMDEVDAKPNWLLLSRFSILSIIRKSYLSKFPFDDEVPFDLSLFSTFVAILKVFVALYWSFKSSISFVLSPLNWDPVQFIIAFRFVVKYMSQRNSKKRILKNDKNELINQFICINIFML